MPVDRFGGGGPSGQRARGRAERDEAVVILGGEARNNTAGRASIARPYRVHLVKWPHQGWKLSTIQVKEILALVERDASA